MGDHEVNTLRLAGRLLLAEGLEERRATLEAWISGSREHHLALDLGEVEALDTAAMQLLIAARRSAFLLGKSLRLLRVQGTPRAHLTLAGLDAVFPELAIDNPPVTAEPDHVG